MTSKKKASLHFRERRGVASVLGILFFLVIFMLAIGALAYTSMLQAQAAQATQQAEQVSAWHAQEGLQFSNGQSGLVAMDTGPTSIQVNHLILKYLNGTVYSLSASASIPQEGTLQVQPLVSTVVCSPGTATCLAKYQQIVKGNPSGSAVGLLTSLGNTFWYSLTSTAPADPTLYYWTTSTQSISSTTFSPISGLSFTGASGTEYLVTIDLVYYQSSSTYQGVTFAISAPGGTTTFLECGGVQLPDAGEICTTAPNTSIGPTAFGGNAVINADYCVGTSEECPFVANAIVSFSSSATFSIEWETAQSSITGYLLANSFISATPVQ